MKNIVLATFLSAITALGMSKPASAQVVGQSSLAEPLLTTYRE